MRLLRYLIVRRVFRANDECLQEVNASLEHFDVDARCHILLQRGPFFHHQVAELARNIYLQIC